MLKNKLLFWVSLAAAVSMAATGCGRSRGGRVFWGGQGSWGFWGCRDRRGFQRCGCSGRCRQGFRWSRRRHQARHETRHETHGKPPSLPGRHQRPLPPSHRFVRVGTTAFPVPAWSSLKKRMIPCSWRSEPREMEATERQ